MSYLNRFIHSCHDSLISGKNEECVSALEYLKNRGLTDKTISENKIGYCLSDEEMPEQIRYFGIKKIHEYNKNGYDYFILGKIIVPIYSELNYSTAFATRTPSFQPGFSWWNTPFKKKNHLFLMNKSRKAIYDINKVYIVEGYMDALMLFQEGIENVVGLMGTSLSSRRVALLSRYCERFCICMDVDENLSGQNAQDKIIFDLKKLDIDNVTIIDGLNMKQDPDEYVRKNGREKFLKLERDISGKELKKIIDKFEKK